MLPPAVKAACEAKLGLPVRRVAFIGGGDINDARLLETSQGPAFLKMNAKAGAIRMFEKEAEGLRILEESGAIRVPRVLGTGQAEGTAFLLLEFIGEGGRTSRFWKNFGNALARLHRHTADCFGLSHGNYIGSLPQSNRRHDNWPEFFIMERLEPQARLALSEQALWNGADRDFGELYKRIPDICPEEPPALIHGDLWSGNFIAAPENTPVLIDPAVSFSHREMDLAMSRLFGGFNPAFYEAYEDTYPCQPGLEERIDIYQLYYLLVHVNLFGGGYAQSVRRIVQHYA